MASVILTRRKFTPKKLLDLVSAEAQKAFGAHVTAQLQNKVVCVYIDQDPEGEYRADNKKPPYIACRCCLEKGRIVFSFGTNHVQSWIEAVLRHRMAYTLKAKIYHEELDETTKAHPKKYSTFKQYLEKCGYRPKRRVREFMNYYKDLSPTYRALISS